MSGQTYIKEPAFSRGTGDPSQGINPDDHVDICLDRGEWDYNLDDRRHSRESNKHHIDDGHKIISNIRKELDDAMVWYNWPNSKADSSDPDDSEIKGFIPRKKLREILTKKRILKVLEWLCNSVDTNELYRKTIHLERPCWKLLAVLILSGEEQSYSKLVLDDGITDACLPFQPDKEEPSSCLASNHSHHFLDLLSRSNSHFSSWSYAVMAPYIRGEPALHKHYILDRHDRLPIATEDGCTDPPQLGKNESRTCRVEGVMFAEEQYRFDSLNDWKDIRKELRPRFAIKRIAHLEDKTRAKFNHELVSMLNLRIQDENQNLIPLLASYEIRGIDDCAIEYGFILPRAQGSLVGNRGFWQTVKPHDDRNKYRQFMLHQCMKLAEALQVIHQTRALEEVKEDNELAKEKTPSYHGDITSHNILWFDTVKSSIGLSEVGRLVIADFGVGDIRQTPLFAAPEVFIENGEMSSASDIFSLGCVFLQFITWYVNGYQKPSKDGFSIWNDGCRLFDLDSSGKSVTLKPEVKKLINDLRSSLTKTEPIIDMLNPPVINLLDSVEERMFEVDVRNRIELPALIELLEGYSSDGLSSQSRDEVNTIEEGLASMTVSS